MQKTETKRSYGSGRIFKHPKSPFWYAAFSVRGEQVRKSTGLRYDPDSNLNERRAQQKLSEFIAEERDAPGRSGNVTYNDLRDLIVRDYENTGKRSLQSLKQSRIHNLDPFFTGWRAKDITEVVVDRYIERRKKQGAAHATINNELAALKRMFSLGVEKRRIAKATVPTIKITNPDNARKGFLELAQFERLKAELPDYLVGLVSWLYATGWRVSEARALRWNDIDEAEGIATINVGDSKNREGRHYPYAQVALAREAIERASAARLPDCPFVFYRKGKRAASWKKIGNFSKAWATAREAAAKKVLAENPTNTSGAGVFTNLIVHDFRRSAAKNLTRSGVSEQVAMKFTGHKTASMFRRYNIVAVEDMRQAASQLDTFMNERAGTTAHAALGGK